MSLILSWLILSLSVYLAAVLLPDVHLRDFGSAIVVAGLFGILNFFLGWIFYTMLGLLTLGIGFVLTLVTRWVVNAILLKLVDGLTDRITIDGFWPAMAAAFLMAVFGTVGEALLNSGGLF